MKTRIVSFLAAVAFASAATVASAAGSSVTVDSEQFIKEAIQGNLAEQKLGQLAQDRGGSEAVRSFGATLKSDHSEAYREATQAAHSMGVMPPSEPSAKQQATYDKLAKLSGDQFDRTFARDMVSDHKKDIAEYEKETKASDEAGSYAKQTLPKLREHLQMAQKLAGDSRAARNDQQTD